MAREIRSQKLNLLTQKTLQHIVCTHMSRMTCQTLKGKLQSSESLTDLTADENYARTGPATQHGGRRTVLQCV